MLNRRQCTVDSMASWRVVKQKMIASSCKKSTVGCNVPLYICHGMDFDAVDPPHMTLNLWHLVL